MFPVPAMHTQFLRSGLWLAGSSWSTEGSFIPSPLPHHLNADWHQLQTRGTAGRWAAQASPGQGTLGQHRGKGWNKEPLRAPTSALGRS